MVRVKESVLLNCQIIHLMGGIQIIGMGDKWSILHILLALFVGGHVGHFSQKYQGGVHQHTVKCYLTMLHSNHILGNTDTTLIYNTSRILFVKISNKNWTCIWRWGNSQMLGSSVLVLTVGNTPMSFKFKYPQSTNLMGRKRTYETNARHQFTRENMTISVLEPIDDLMMTHGVSVLYNTVGDVNIWYQICYCFRWLTSSKEFYVDTCTMRLDSNTAGGKKCNKVTNRNIFT